MRKRLLSILQFVIFFGFGIFLVWWSVQKMGDKNWEDCKTALKSARYFLFIPVFLILTASHISRSMRWRLLMRPLGYQPGLFNTFCAVMVGYLANLAVPRLGEVLKCTILNRYEKIPADKLIGTIIVERAVDAISLAIVFLVAILSQAHIIGNYARTTIVDKFFAGSIQGFLVKMLIFAAVVIGIYFLVRFLSRKYSDRGIILRLKNGVKGVGAGLNSIRTMQNKKAFIFHSLFIWACYIGGTYLGFSAIRETAHLSFAAVFPVLAFASIGMIITPGGIGAYPLFIMEVMLLYGIEEGHGFANGTLQWFAQFLIILVVGFLSLIILPYYNKRKHHAQHTVNPQKNS